MTAERFDLIIIGGGPGGSTAAAIASGAGLRVLLLEASSHPKPHVGESALPGIIPILEEMGALESVQRAGFHKKTGSTHWNWGTTKEWDLWFRDTDHYDHAWFLERPQFDQILFKAAKNRGAVAQEHCRVTELLWEGSRLTGVRYQERGSRSPIEARAPVTIDASGQAALVARHLGLREMIPGLRHRASWAHFGDADFLPPPHHQQAVFAADKTHWIWAFPFPEGRASVGIVRLEQNAPKAFDNPEQEYDALIAAHPRIENLLGPAAHRTTPVRVERDWSYRVASAAGEGFMLVGDAAGFIDPILSTGVFLSMQSGYRAAKAAIAIRQGEPEALALKTYNTEQQEVFSDLLRMVRFFYQQNLDQDDYFWESKRILMTRETELRPQKAFMILTSGLVGNLALDERTEKKRAKLMSEQAQSVNDAENTELGFVCIHLMHHVEGKPPAALYLLVEPHHPAEPTLSRTLNFNVNAIAPRYNNDVMMEPGVRPHFRSFTSLLKQLDTEPEEALAPFWNRARADIQAWLGKLPGEFTLSRVFGQ